MRLNQVTVPTLDVEKSVIFYQKLGLKLIVLSENNYARFEMPEGGSTFSVHKVDKLGEEERVWVYFECEDLELKVNQLTENGFVFEENLEMKPWLWLEARLRDPDDNVLILYFAGENRLNPPWRLR